MANLNESRSSDPNWSHISIIPTDQIESVTLLFDDIENTIANLIQQSRKIVGCMAWFTSARLLPLLIGKQVSIIVQKDRLFFPYKNNKKQQNISNRLKEHYTNIESTLLDDHIGRLDPFRIYGDLPKKSANDMARLHHKFLVFDDKIVVTGSFNCTATANNSLENVLIIRDTNLVRAYLSEYQVLLRGSKRLHWYYRN